MTKKEPVKYTLELTAAQVVMLSQAMEVYSNENYSSSDDYDPEPLETLRALVDDLAHVIDSD